MVPCRIAALAILTSLSLTTVACSSSTEEPAPEASRAALRGVFHPSLSGDAAIDEIEFRDTHYRLLPRGCKDAACEEQGTFELDAAKHLLRLHVEPANRLYELRFDIHTTRKPDRSAGALAPAATQLLEATEVELIESATLDGRDYSLFEENTDQCDNSGLWPRIWEGQLCGGTSKTFGFAHCYVKTSGCQSTGRSCLDDNTTGQRWDSRKDECRELGGTLFESQGPGIYVAQACCRPRR